MTLRRRVSIGIRHAADALRRPGRQRWIVATGLILGAMLLVFRVLPVVRFDDPLSTVVLDRDGDLLGASIAADGQWRFGVPGAVPSRFVAAITRSEDRRFFRHPGVDPLAMARALSQNLARREVVSGGSTITMQVVRLSRRGRQRTVMEKAIEVVLALRVEASLSKREILGLYAAYAPFGGNTVGLDAAAWRYFGRPPDRLTWAETAMLAVLPNAPSLIHPGRNRDTLKRKRDRLLASLRDSGTIDAMTCGLAQLEPLPPAPMPVPRLAPHLLARAQAERVPAQTRTGKPSPWVRTMVMRSLQERVNTVLMRHQRALADRGVFNAAALVLDVKTGHVLAYAGNLPPLDASEHGHDVDLIPAPRSTGSILKPLLFAGLLDAGEVLPGQIVPDVPTHIGTFHPENFSRTYAGAVPAELALARSLNVPAVRMLRSYGVDRFCGLLRTLGVTTLTRPARDYGLSLILGGAEATLRDVTAVYAGLARTVLEPPRSKNRAARPIGAGAAYLTLEAMLRVERPGDEFAWRAFQAAQKVAWKTGTSYGFRDAWAVGVTPRYAVGVWVGNADGEGRPGLTGYAVAAPMLFEIFGQLPAGGWFTPPVDDLREVEVCAHSGMRRGPYCVEAGRRLVPPAGLQSPPCSYCHLVHCNQDTTFQVHGDCEPVFAIHTVPWFVLPPGMEWYYRRQHSDYRPPPPIRADCREALGGEGIALSFVYPRERALLYVPIEMNGTLGRIVFEAAHRNAEATVYWHLDDTFVGETREIHRMALAPAPGRHVLSLVDEDGGMVRRTFTVLDRKSDRSSASDPQLRAHAASIQR